VSKRLEEIKIMIKAFDGDLEAELFGVQIEGQVIVDELKWLVEQAENADVALYELERLHQTASPAEGSHVDRQFKYIIKMLKEGKDGR
jgi:hypothetical protein